jgi:hypothetical protein
VPAGTARPAGPTRGAASEWGAGSEGEPGSVREAGSACAAGPEPEAGTEGEAGSADGACSAWAAGAVERGVAGSSSCPAPAPASVSGSARNRAIQSLISSALRSSGGNLSFICKPSAAMCEAVGRLPGLSTLPPSDHRQINSWYTFSILNDGRTERIRSVANIFVHKGRATFTQVTGHKPVRLTGNIPSVYTGLALFCTRHPQVLHNGPMCARPAGHAQACGMPGSPPAAIPGQRIPRVLTVRLNVAGCVLAALVPIATQPVARSPRFTGRRTRFTRRRTRLTGRRTRLTGRRTVQRARNGAQRAGTRLTGRGRMRAGCARTVPTAGR